MRLRAGPAALLLLAALPTCTKDEANQRAKARIWGNEDPPTEAVRRSKEPIDAEALGADQERTQRVIGMRFEEVVARIGFVELRNKASIVAGKGTRKLTVVEESLIEQGLHGSFHVLQKDAEGNPTREAYYDNRVLYLRNGTGQMRIQGIVKDQHIEIREEAWQPFRTFAGYFGERLGLEKRGPVEAFSRPAVEYKIVLDKGPELIKDPTGDDAPKKPRALKGTLIVDKETGVPLKVTLQGELDVPAKKAGAEPGNLEVSLEQELKPVEGVEHKPKSFVPTIKRHPTDLEPLAFLDGGIRTSTVIGGKKAKTSSKGKTAEPEEEPGE